MAAEETGGKIPSALVPACPVCGGPMQVHMEMDHNFIPDTKGQKHLTDFLEQYHGKKLVILELGIGWRNQLIKAPLMRADGKRTPGFLCNGKFGERYLFRMKSRRSHTDWMEIWPECFMHLLKYGG